MKFLLWSTLLLGVSCSTLLKDGSTGGHNPRDGGHHNPREGGNHNPRQSECGIPEWKGDGICDDENNNAACEFDGGDCNDSNNCAIPEFKGDGFCDEENNNAACEFDGGDCSSSGTTAAPVTTAAPTTTVAGPTTTAAPGDCECGVKGSVGRIVGGTNADDGEYTWQVGLVQMDNTSPFCGGSLITNKHVLTAAHCVTDTSVKIRVALGDYNSQTTDGEVFINVVKITNHPEYDKPKETLDNDFSILELETPVTFSSRVNPVCLPDDLTKTFVGATATVSGWGNLQFGGNGPAILQEVDVEVLANTNCGNNQGITSNMLCAGVLAGGKDSCQGDSGGPLVTKEGNSYTLIGVVSFGEGCAQPNWPGVYARVTAQMNWIKDNINGGTICPRRK